MSKIRTYKCFSACMDIVSIDLYRMLFKSAYKEACKRLELLQIDNPKQYKEWLSRWKYSK